MVRVVAISAAWMLAVSSVSSAAEVPSGESAVERLDRAHREGRIDAPTHALLGLRLVRAPATMPEEFRPSAGEKIRCGTLRARRATTFAREGLFSREQEAEFWGLGGRPNLPSYETVTIGPDVIATLHWDTDTDDAEKNALIAYLTTAWSVEITGMGWRRPVDDAGSGAANVDPDVELDIYIDPGQAGGLTMQDVDGPGTWDDAASYIIIESDLAAPETFIAHELHHAIQYAYDYADADMIYEATATWIEDKVFDASNDYVFYIDDFQSYPERTLSFATYSDNYMYGAALFLHWLSDQHDAGGVALVEGVWEALKEAGVDYYEALDSLLANEGFSGLGDAYAEFAGYRYLTGDYDDGSIEEGEHIPEVDVEESYADFASIASGESEHAVNVLAANYVKVALPDAVEGDNLTLTAKGDGEGPWSVTVIAIPEGGGPAVVTVVPDDDGDGTVEATVNDLDALLEVVFAIAHVGGVDAGPDYDGGADLETFGLSWSFGKGKEDVGCGCRIPARAKPFDASTLLGVLAFGAALILQRRRAG